MTWQLRSAHADDLDALMQLETLLFAPDDWSRQVMAAELADPNGHYLIAHPPGQPDTIVAYAGLRAPRGAPQADVQTIGVIPEARRQGLGRVLLTQLVNEARRRGATELFLEVRADNPGAQSLYDSLGFEPIATRARYYRGGVDAVIMRLRIPATEVRTA